MKIIFLDIDGVLNSRQSMEKTKQQYPNKEIRVDTPHLDHIRWLNKITDATGAKLVISSTWRSDFSVVGWNRYFDLLNVHADVISKTPKLDSYRGTEIQCWLLEHKSKIVKYSDSQWFYYKEPIENFVILDDDSDMEDLLPHLIKINNEIGLTEEDADKAIKILNETKI